MMFKGEIFLNFWLSVLIYNPLEAFILIYFCSIFTEIRINKSTIKHCYILGFINLLFQYYTTFLDIEIISFCYDIFVALFLSPLILKNYFSNFVYKNIKIDIFIYSCIFNFITIFLCNYIISKFLNFDYSYIGYNCLISEFFSNCISKFLQFVFLYLLKGCRFYMKKFLKNIAFKNTEKAFTIMKMYQPKMPKILKEKLNKNK